MIKYLITVIVVLTSFTKVEAQGIITSQPVTLTTSELPELPRVSVETKYSQPVGRTINVNAGDNLQTAFDTVMPGDTIVLQAGATFIGNFRLNPGLLNSEGPKWIYIVSSSLVQLSEGNRVNLDSKIHMPKIISPNDKPAITTHWAVNYVRFSGIEFNTNVKNINLILMGYGFVGNERVKATKISQLPHHITFDRCLIHSTSDTLAARNGILADGLHIAVINSYIANFKDRSDANAIWVTQGGPHKIVNNYLEGAGENIMLGAHSVSSPELIPSDFEIRQNHFFKREAWKEYGTGRPDLWTCKNLFEIKNGQRVLLEGNIFENSWVDGQVGTAFVFTPRNGDFNAPWNRVWDITIRHNIIRKIGTGFLIAGENDLNKPTEQTQRILFSNNFMEVTTDSISLTRFFKINVPNGGRPVKDLTIKNNTILHRTGEIGNAAIFFEYGAGVNVDGMVMENNILTYGQYGFHVTGGTLWSKQAVTNYSVGNNGFIFRPDQTIPINTFAVNYPGNLKVNSINDAGFTDYVNENYRLTDSSPFKNAGTDGKDLGVNFDELESATDGIGQW